MPSRRTALRYMLGGMLASLACRPAAPVGPAAASLPLSPLPKTLGAQGPSVGAVGSYVSHPWSFSTVSYWVEGPTGLVLIDTQFLTSATLQFVELAERITGKTAKLAVVLHANPDKFNGTRVLQDRGIEVVTSSQVLELIPGIHRTRARAFAQRYAPVYPTEVPEPASFGRTTTTLRAGGLELTAHLGGAGCSEAHVWVSYEDHVFVGDLVAKGAHPWLEIGRPDAWRDRLREILTLDPYHVHAGRGGSGGPDVVAAQMDYLEFLIARVQQAQPRGAPTADVLRPIRADIEARYPSLEFSVFLNIGLPAVWRHYAAQAEGERARRATPPGPSPMASRGAAAAASMR